ncbi:ribosome maturation factor RimM [Micrococcus lylae]|uniref:ribosome maturation factor RimM n=1 Tax=Micrococcus lylae TaxID=1273 RepID=UPI000C80BE19|nr:ribosome maturation factor RimM [Micrococcus lylae]WIK82699.1 ribosome maturation factor RimM [Micrococcus lylae]
MSTRTEGLVRLARIGKPHGIRGEVTVQLFTDDPETRFAPGSVLTAEGPAGTPAELTVTRARWNKQILVLGFEQSPDRNAAEALRGTQLFAAPEDRAEDDEWYEDDLLDLAVEADGRHIGTVVGLITGPAQDLLEIVVEGRDEPVLVPFVEEIVPEVDEERGAVLLTPPPGLLDLNEPGADEAPDMESEA